MILDGKKIAEEVRSELAAEIQILAKNTLRPGLGILLAGDDPASVLYVSIKERVARELGFFCDVKRLSNDTPEDEIIRVLKSIQDDIRIHGLIVQLPLPNQSMSDVVLSLLNPLKDIDCLSPQNISALFLGKELVFDPPTASAVWHLIKHTGVLFEQVHCVVVGRGFFARQIAAYLLYRGGTVTIVSSRSPNLSALTSTADIVIAAAGRPGCITKDMIRAGAVVVDVGIHTEGTQVFGDVDPSVSEVAGYYSPVPGGVGPLTVMLLMENVVKAARRLLTME